MDLCPAFYFSGLSWRDQINGPVLKMISSRTRSWGSLSLSWFRSEADSSWSCCLFHVHFISQASWTQRTAMEHKWKINLLEEYWMTHRIGWEMEHQSWKTGRNQRLAASAVWLRRQTLQTSHSSLLLGMVRLALWHLLLTLPACITDWVLQWAPSCRV